MVEDDGEGEPPLGLTEKSIVGLLLDCSDTENEGRILINLFS